METVRPADLTHVILDCPPELKSVVRQVVSCKDTLDDLCRTESGRWLVRRTCPQLLNLAQSALPPQGFVHAVFPFIEFSSEERPGLIDLQILIGEPWKWRTCRATGRTADELEAYLLDPLRARMNDEQASRTTLIAELGIAFASEGKNRVRFLRDRGVRAMPSSIALASYPAAHRLRVIRLAADGRNSTFCVLDDRWVRPLLLPELTQMVLSVYGVATERSWPAGWPGIEAVMASIEERTRDGALLLQPVDLHRLPIPATAGAPPAESSPTSLMATHSHRLRWNRILYAAAAVVSVAGCAPLLPEPWNRNLLWAAAGLLIGGGALLFAPLIKTQPDDRL